MNLGKAIGFGAAIWVLIFVIVSVFVGFNIYNNTLMKAVAVVIVGIIAFIFAGYAKPQKFSSALGYGIIWVIIGLILDFIVTTKFNPVIFSSRALWAGYLLILVTPLLKIKKVV